MGTWFKFNQSSWILKAVTNTHCTHILFLKRVLGKSSHHFAGNKYSPFKTMSDLHRKSQHGFKCKCRIWKCLSPSLVPSFSLPLGLRSLKYACSLSPGFRKDCTLCTRSPLTATINLPGNTLKIMGANRNKSTLKLPVTPSSSSALCLLTTWLSLWFQSCTPARVLWSAGNLLLLSGCSGIYLALIGTPLSPCGILPLGKAIYPYRPRALLLWLGVVLYSEIAALGSEFNQNLG